MKQQIQENANNVVTLQMLKDIQRKLKPYGRQVITNLSLTLAKEAKTKGSLIYKHPKKISETTIYNIFNGVITNPNMRFILYHKAVETYNKYVEMQSQYLKN